ncbi:MAG TPA: hypothetical protein PLJ46_05665 [Burkholderiaceae bacterium]|nr:hypothetical protein [Rhodoferax sp.]HQZ05336.1 hypothetical protein [Burkholderiaceae bacterium]
MTDKVAAKHPRVNKGEEENNPVVAPDRQASGRLRSSKPVQNRVMHSAFPIRDVLDKFPVQGATETGTWKVQV